MISIAAILITKNEQHNIRACLESISWIPEIVVIDAGSTDQTVPVAKERTSKVFVRPWDGYGAAKNFALTQTSAEWIFWIDADERVTTDLRTEMEGLLTSAPSEVAAYDMPRKANFLGRWILHGGWYPGRVTRLFRKSRASFTEEKVHERLQVQGKTEHLHSDLLHYTDPNLFHYFDKFNRYTTLAAEELATRGKRFRIGSLIVNPLWLFVRMYVLKLGFLDGIQGFILCVLSSCYVFTKYAKLWEVQQPSGGKP